jgi:hypothetical protein
MSTIAAHAPAIPSMLQEARREKKKDNMSFVFKGDFLEMPYNNSTSISLARIQSYGCYLVERSAGDCSFCYGDNVLDQA